MFINKKTVTDDELKQVVNDDAFYVLNEFSSSESDSCDEIILNGYCKSTCGEILLQRVECISTPTQDEKPFCF